MGQIAALTRGKEMSNISGPTIILISIVACAVLLVFVVLNYLQKKRKGVVLQLSKKIPRIQSLNQNYRFFDLPGNLPLHKYCNSKREYERAVLKEYLEEQISDNREYYFDLITKSNKNQKDHKRYLSSFEAIMKNDSLEDKQNYDKYSFFRETEAKICDSLMLRPVADLCVRITKSYVSPRGRNAYRSTEEFRFSDIIECYNASGQAKIFQQSAKYQRALMTDSLRYDIMKRDGFKCVICGATAKDGVKLHVDHIVPVSKGGKTVPDNLRTLCANCNLGKRAKYDPNGLN